MSKERELLRRALECLETTQYFDKIPLGGKAIEDEIRAHLAAEEEHEHEYVGKGSRPDHWRCIHCGKIIKREESP